jgi:hypothetical protein
MKASLIPLALVLLAGCGHGSGDQNPSTNPDSPAPETTASTSSTPPVDPKITAAVNAYLAFWRATNIAQEHPPKLGAPWPNGGDFTEYSFDPIKSQFAGYITTLNRQGQAWRGTAPSARVHVQASDLTASPYPTVMVANCPTNEPSWRQIDVATGKPASTAPGAVPPPYLVTAEMIFYKGHWGADKVTPDTSRTCTA